MECFDDETVLALLQGELDENHVCGIVQHMDACAACRRLVSSLAEAAEGWISPAAGAPRPPCAPR